MTDESRDFPLAPTSVTHARRFVLEHVHAARELTDAVALMVSELATNALLHAKTAFTVRVRTSADEIRVDVSDDGDGTPAERNPLPHEPTGRGLKLVAATADAWGVVLATSRPGKTVWFTVQVPSRGGQTGAAHERRTDGPRRARWSQAVPRRSNAAPASARGRTSTRSATRRNLPRLQIGGAGDADLLVTAPVVARELGRARIEQVEVSVERARVAQEA